VSEPAAAKRSDWKAKPMPAARRRLELILVLDAAQRRRVEQGLVPRAMEDKWFAFVEAGRLHLCRSWTGFTIFEATLAPKADGSAMLCDVIVNDDGQQFGGSEMFAAEMFETTVRDVLLARRRVDESTYALWKKDWR
jgi:hypothetical protein